jgi:hypothetical protein
MAAERRTSQRLRTLKGGSILFGLAPAIDCVVRNLSATGACLAVPNPAAIPEQFDLLIKPELLKRHCRVAWRTADRIGIRFVEPPRTP